MDHTGFLTKSYTPDNEIYLINNKEGVDKVNDLQALRYWLQKFYFEALGEIIVQTSLSVAEKTKNGKQYLEIQTLSNENMNVYC